VFFAFGFTVAGVAIWEMLLSTPMVEAPSKQRSLY
jgi:hypothetical protein